MSDYEYWTEHDSNSKQMRESHPYLYGYERPANEGGYFPVSVGLPSTPKGRKNPRWFPILAVALVFSILGSAFGAGGVLFAQELQKEKAAQQTEIQLENISNFLQGQRESSVINIVDIDTGTLMTPAEVYAANVNSTVGITTSVTTNYWGFQSTSAASGSGFIISDDGYILTNYHVIESSNSITVSTYDGGSYGAVLIGYDSSNDIAVLKIEADNLVPVVLGDSDNLNVGDSVVAIGNPLGELTFSLTYGTISAKDREVTLSSSVTMDLLQTDCAINSGNSGGALFNLYGEVIGVTNAKYSSSSSSEASIDNIGFAIPINSIRSIVESIIEKGYISKPYIGISVLDVSEETQQYGIPTGAAVQAVNENSPAAEAGLQKGDVITAVNGTQMTSSELVDFVGASSVNDTLVLNIYRQGENLELTVVVGEQIQSALEQEDTNQQQKYSGNSHRENGGRP